MATYPTMMSFILRFTGVITLGWALSILIMLGLGYVFPSEEMIISASLITDNEANNIYRFDLSRNLIYKITNNTDHGYAFEPNWSPDREQIVFISPRSGGFDLYLMNAEGGDIRRLTDYPEEERNPNWSPSGQHIVYIQLGHGITSQMVLVNLKSGETHRVTDNVFDENSPTWSPDGRYLTFVAYVNNMSGPDIYNFDFHTGESYPLITSPDYVGNPLWSPDGRYILYTATISTDIQHGIYLWDVLHNKGILLYPFNRIRSFEELNWSPDGHSITFISRTDYGLPLTISSANLNGIFKFDVDACLEQKGHCEPTLLTHIPGNYKNARWRPTQP